MSWVHLQGRFAEKDNEIYFDGTPAPRPRGEGSTSVEPESQEKAQPPPFGFAVCNQRFSEGTISVDVQFDSVDAQTVAEILIILIQCDPTTDEMLNAGLGGGPVLFAIRQWMTEESAASSEQPGSKGRRKVWKGFRLGGDRHNLQPGRFTA